MNVTDALFQELNKARQQQQSSREARSMQRRILTDLGDLVESDLLKFNHLKV